MQHAIDPTLSRTEMFSQGLAIHPVDTGEIVESLLRQGQVNEAINLCEKVCEYFETENEYIECSDASKDYYNWEMKYFTPQFDALIALSGADADAIYDMRDGLFMIPKTERPDFNSLLKVA
jgi:hypothetical protein